ncbi:DUF503 domain-containing protein [Desulfohalobium retbaense]|uniref:DUF503 domain-containing protein n=1 Tax=Desulfohalobium retbaense (strain ATCC 49708 / DSM 5692 / JCM 16813 / HR100) TaxID=485915 RepID=C8X0G6_DESRD|nr:DUF503 domain-containing protein [Desulfohalobium retbaense]ACV67791.1 protein of unknown function DUF503 [Desulfohalobium retbaense DSM 5692]
MHIGLLSIEFYLHGIGSLKDKRRIANSLKQKLRNKFNVAVAEIDTQHSHTWLKLEILTLANERARVESVLNKALAMVEAISDEEITDVHTDIFGV